jgi:hypothetical protein
MTDHIIHSEDGQTYDLTQNRITFGLLPKDVQEAMKAWPHGWEIFNGKIWHSILDSAWYFENTYRAIPTPKVKEHVLFWKAGLDAIMSERCSVWQLIDTHRIIIRDDGTGNLTATVEKL